MARVLVVEDVADIAQMIGGLFEHWGHEVRIAYEGHSALQTAESFDPDLVMLDIGIPGQLTGIDVASEIRSLAHSSKRPVLIVLSGYAIETHRNQAMRAGVTHYLSKPVDVPRLKTLVDSYLSPAPPP